MKVLTICQPYPFLIMLPDSDPRAKRVENRSWHWDHRGPLAIHAGKSRAWMHPEDMTGYGIDKADLVFGAIVGVVDMIASVHIDRICSRNLPAHLSWLKTHKHCNGPWCHVYANPRPLAHPIVVSGKQGPWDYPDDLIEQALRAPASPNRPLRQSLFADPDLNMNWPETKPEGEADKS